MDPLQMNKHKPMGVMFLLDPLHLNNNGGGPTHRGVCLALAKATQPIDYTKYNI
jgi:hypothetical protein